MELTKGRNELYSLNMYYRTKIFHHQVRGKENWNRSSTLNPIIPGLFLNSIFPGGGKFAPPYKMPNNGREVPKLSWNLISYRDWCQTKGFTTFRHLEPPQLMVWKVTFFWWFMRFVRVPLMKVGQIGPTFLVPEKTVNFFRVKPAVSSFTLKMRKSHKKLARVYAYTHAYTQIRDGGGKYAPPR